MVYDKGNYSTFEAARKRKLPLVTAAWVENCNLDNEMKKPRDYRSSNPVSYFKYFICKHKYTFIFF